MPDGTYRQVMISEIDAAIDVANRDPFEALVEESSNSACAAHKPLIHALRESNRNQAAGQIVLLRLAKAAAEAPPVTISSDTHAHISRKEVVAWCVGAGSFVGGLIEGAKHLFAK